MQDLRHWFEAYILFKNEKKLNELILFSNLFSSSSLKKVNFRSVQVHLAKKWTKFSSKFAKKANFRTELNFSVQFHHFLGHYNFLLWWQILSTTTYIIIGIWNIFLEWSPLLRKLPIIRRKDWHYLLLFFPFEIMLTVLFFQGIWCLDGDMESKIYKR